MPRKKGHLTNHKLLGERVQQERRRQGLTQEDLATKIGTTQSQLSQFERGQDGVVSSEVLNRLTNFLEILPQKKEASTTSLFFCPNPLCGEALVQKHRFMLLNGRIKKLDSAAYSITPCFFQNEFSSSLFCRHCGTSMESSCPDCQEDVQNAGCYCERCGGPFINSADARVIGEEALLSPKPTVNIEEEATV